MSVELGDIQAAAAKIQGAVVRTPFLHSRTLSELCGAELHIKFENLQFTASFKERGALNKLLSLTDAERERGVIAMSAGNHAQGVAYHAQRLGIRAVIVMPKHTPFVKVRHTRDFGAKVVLAGENLTEAAERARELTQENDFVFIHPFDDDHIIAGQGTVALEMLDENPQLDVMVVPVGGGGLIAGMAAAAKALKPDIRIIAAESERYPSLSAGLRGEPAQCGGDTVAEGIAVKAVGEKNLALARRLVDDVLLVDEAALEKSVALLLNVEKTAAEGAGAAGLAAMLSHPDVFKGAKVGMVLCGGNIDSRLLANILLRNLVHEGRIARLRIEIRDTPGALARIATLTAEHGGNIIDAGHQRIFAHIPVKNAYLDLAVETRDAKHMAEITAAIQAAGFSVRVLDDE